MTASEKMIREYLTRGTRKDARESRHRLLARTAPRIPMGDPVVIARGVYRITRHGWEPVALEQAK